MPFSGAVMLSDKDNVATTLEDIEAGAEVAVRLGGKVTSIEALEKIPFGFKVAVADIAKGTHVLKYGESIPFDHSSDGRIEVVANPVTGEEIVVKLSRKVTTVPCITSFVLNQSMNKISQLNFPLLTVKTPIDAGTMKE